MSTTSDNSTTTDSSTTTTTDSSTTTTTNCQKILVTVVSKLLTGIDELRQPFWTDIERVRVANNLLLPSKWQENPLKNLENIFTDALAKPISRKLVIKKDEYIYYSITNKYFEDSHVINTYYFLTDKNYQPNRTGTIQFTGNRFKATNNKNMYSENLRILRAKESNETVNLGDSILTAEALYEDNGSGSVTATASSVIYTVLNAVGIFQEVKSVEIAFNNTNNTRIVTLHYNSA